MEVNYLFACAAVAGAGVDCNHMVVYGEDEHQHGREWMSDRH